MGTILLMCSLNLRSRKGSDHMKAPWSATAAIAAADCDRAIVKIEGK